MTLGTILREASRRPIGECFISSPLYGFQSLNKTAHTLLHFSIPNLILEAEIPFPRTFNLVEKSKCELLLDEWNMEPCNLSLQSSLKPGFLVPETVGIDASQGSGR